ncbi:hypothetical protein [Synechococcus sp. M16CYN]|uniref:hypothetical protein n=1 Tax=Synechococcus sp. M16CYN TaxID=3103139 RepID=UPI003253C123
MTNSYNDIQQQGGQGGNRRYERGRGGRGGNRESGGFRIRLSDNEMGAVKALQEAFNLRSPVAVLGFAVRTLAQMLANGQLADLIEQQRDQAANSGRRDSKNRRFDNESGGNRGSRPDPFARPSKPKPKLETTSEQEIATDTEMPSESEGDVDISSVDSSNLTVITADPSVKLDEGKTAEIEA